MPDKKHIIKQYTKAIEATTYYEIGKAVADARHSVKAMLALPFKIAAIAKQQKNVIQSQNIPNQSNNFSTHSKLTLNAHALTLLDHCQYDSKTVIEHCENTITNSDERRQIIVEMARICAYSNTTLAINLIEQLPSAEKNPQLLKKLAFLLYDAGEISSPARILDNKDVNECLIGDEHIKSRRIIAESLILQQGYCIPNKTLYSPKTQTRIAYICHTSFPHHTNGYAVRTHNIAHHLKKQGLDIHCVSRPGYPWDRKDALNRYDIKDTIDIDGLTYYHYQTANAGKQPFDQFVEAAAETLYKHIQQHAITHILAASNYLNALPALIASRRAGIPFIYDIRGLWEYTAASKITDWENTERFHYFRKLETLVANQADNIVALSAALKEELVDRGIEADKIAIALNATSHLSFTYSISREQLRKQLGIPNNAFIVGFIGSIEKYEGLDYLAQAIAQLKQKNISVYALVVGSGSAMSSLHDLTCQLGIADQFRFTGRLLWDDAQNYYQAIDVCTYPRRTDKVCTIVPPLKPLEAMAHGKPIIISDLKPLIELTGGIPSVTTIESESTESLAEALEQLIDKNNIFEPKESIHFIKNNRSWNQTILTYQQIFGQPH